MFKKIVLSCLMMGSLPLSAQQLYSYSDIEQTLSEGKLVSIVVNYADCDINNPNPISPPMAKAVIRPHTFIIRDNDGIYVSGSLFTTAIPSGPQNGTDQRYSLVINAQNQMLGKIKFFNADDRQQSDLKDITFKCELNKGIKVYN